MRQTLIIHTEELFVYNMTEFCSAVLEKKILH